jgi:two-component system response regulator NreC
MEVVGEIDRIDDAARLIEEVRPDVIVTDLRIDSADGLDALRAIKSEASGVKILILAYARLSEYFQLAMRAGADGYLTREAEPVEVIHAVRSVARGHTYVHPSIATLLVSTYVCKTAKGQLEDPHDILSDREREIVCLAATGHTNSEIAPILHLSKQTVHNVRARLMEKLGLHDRLELLKYAIRRGIINVEDM